MEESEKEKYLRELKEFYKNKGRKKFKEDTEERNGKSDDAESVKKVEKEDGNASNSENNIQQLEVSDTSTDSGEKENNDNSSTSKDEQIKQGESLSFWAKLLVYKNFAKVAIYFVVTLWTLIWIADNYVIEKLVHQKEIIVLPNLEGIDSSDAINILQKLGLRPLVSKAQHSKKYSSGKVIRQIPRAEEKVRHGRPIYLTISLGSEIVIVPNLKGKTARGARAEIMNLGLSPGKIKYIYHERVVADCVVRQSREAGSKAQIGDEISLTVSRGSENLIIMPSLLGVSIENIEDLLGEFDLNIGTISYIKDETYQDATVIGQFPEAGEMTLRNSYVDLEVVKNEDDDLFEY